MTTIQPRSCDEVRLAALARLDGEQANLTAGEVDAHVAGCAECRAALADLAALHLKLERTDFESLDMDLWPAVQHRLPAASSPRTAAERPALFALTVVLVGWRLAQLLLDVPAPVVNSVVPLLLIAIVLWRLVGDPFAIRLSSDQLRQEGTS